MKARRISGRGPTDKTIVLGMLERGGIVKTKVVDDRKRTTLHREVKDTVAAGSALYSDDLSSYHGLQSDYAHQTVDHAIRYVDGVVHTNTLENFWSLLKRCINGTWVSVERWSHSTCSATWMSRRTAGTSAGGRTVIGSIGRSTRYSVSVSPTNS